MNELKQIISDYVGVPADNLNENTSLVGDIGIDSFGLVSLICTLEDTFECNIPDYELSSFQTLNDLSTYLSQNSTVFARA